MAKKSISRIEVEPVRFYVDPKNDKIYAEVTTPKRAKVWGVYCRYTTGMAQWKSDHRTKSKAVTVARRLASKHGVEAVVRKG